MLGETKASRQELEGTVFVSAMSLSQAASIRKVAQLLNQNLKEQRETLRKMEAFSKRVKPNELMSEEQSQKVLSARTSSRAKRAA